MKKNFKMFMCAAVLLSLSCHGANATSITDEVTINGVNNPPESYDSWTVVNGNEWSGKANLSNTGALTTSAYQGTGVINGTGGTFALTNGSSVTLGSGSSITSAVATAVESGSTLTVDGATVAMNSPIAGNLVLSSGNLTLGNALGASGKLTANGGNLTIAGNNLAFANDSTIASAAKLTINSDVAIAQAGGTINLNDTDVWAGDITTTAGTLNIYGTATSGGYKSGDLTTLGGTLNIGSDTTTGTLQMNADDSISDNTVVNIGSKGALNLENGAGALKLDSGDTWNGTVKQTGSTSLTLDGVDKRGTLISESGNLTIGNGSDAYTLSMDKSSDKILAATNVNLQTNAKLSQSAGNVTLNSGDTWNGEVDLTGGNLTVLDSVKTASNVLNATGGTLNIGNANTSATVVIDADDTLTNDVQLKIYRTDAGTNSVLSQIGGTVAIGGTGDVLNGTYNQTGGVLNVLGDKLTRGADSVFTSSNSTLNIGNGSSTVSKLALVNVSDNIAQDTTMNITKNGTLDMQAGQVAFDSATDKILAGGGIKQTGGILNLVGDISKANDVKAGYISSTNGVLNLNNANLVLDNAKDQIGADTTLNLLGTSKLTLDNADSKATFTNGDTWVADGENANVILNKGTLTILGDATNVDGYKKGNLVTTGGNLKVEGNATTEGKLEIGTGEEIAAATMVNIGTNADKTHSTLIVSDGNVTLNTGDNLYGNLEHNNGGNLVLDGVKRYSGGGWLKSTDGTMTIGNETSETSLALNNTDDLIAADTQVDIKSKAVVNMSKGDVTLDETATTPDNWAGKINLSGGKLTVLDSVKKAASKLVATGGDFVVGSADNKATATISEGDSIAKATKVVINRTTAGENSELVQEGGTVELGGTGDVLNGTYNQTGGVLNIVDALVGRGANSIFKSNGGDLNIGDGATPEFTFALDHASDEIGSDSIVTLAKEATLAISNDGAKATLDLGDTWNGAVNQTAGELTLDRVEKGEGAKFSSTGGKLNIGNGTDEYTLVLDDADDLLAKATTVDLKANATLEQRAGVVTLDDGDTWNGSINHVNGEMNFDKVTKETTPESTFNQSGGLLNMNDTTLTLKEGSAITGGMVDMDKDTASALTLKNGVANAAQMFMDDAASNLNVEQTDSDPAARTTLTVLGDSNISEGTISLVGSTMNLVNSANINGTADINVDSSSIVNSYSNGFVADTVNTSGLINAINYADGLGAMETYNAVTMNIGSGADNVADFTTNILARNNFINDNDTYNSHFRNESGKQYAYVNVSDWALGNDIYGYDAPLDRSIALQDIFTGKANSDVIFTAGDKTKFTPIGWYQLRNTTGKMNGYTLDMVKYNPQVFRGQVATVAQYQNQLLINDMMFNHTMLLPSFKDGDSVGSSMANKYAAINPLYAPYQYSNKDGGLWVKMYGNFEKDQMTEVGSVTNNSYGALIGADFGLKQLGNGWSFMPTAYLGYNGAHQAFSRVSNYQNGGQLGFLGTFYKNNWSIGTLAYGGIYNNNMDIGTLVDGPYSANDDTFNYFAGAAVKAAYNWRFHRDWVLQPNFYAGYNYFGQQNWHSTFGQMGMMADALHGANIAPGLNLIWEKETFSTYLTVQYMYNLQQACGGRAGTVGLSSISMDRGFLQYGIGFTKKFTDRFSGYFQAVLRNVGRNGVGFQMGFNYYLGK